MNNNDPNGPVPPGEAQPNAEPQKEGGQQPTPDARAERMRQIRRALILGGGLVAASHSAGGFDPYNSSETPSQDRWGVRRRD